MAKEEVPLHQRLKEARLRTAAERRESVSQEKMAELVGALLGRKVQQSAWSDYENGKAEPPIDVFKAVARLSKLSFLYLTLGRDQEGDDDELIDPLRDRKLTPEEEARATQAAAAEREAEAARRRAKGARGKGGRKK